MEKIEYRGHTIRIVIDEMPLDPRSEFDNLGTMYCWHRNYNLGDEKPSGLEPGEFIETLNRGKKKHIVLPLYLFDHSGITIKTTPFNDPWDSGQVGYVFIEVDRALKEFGAKRMTSKLREKVEQALRGEVKTYDDYLTGNVYGFVVEDKDGEVIDSCYGFYGWESRDEMVAMCKNTIDTVIRENTKKHLSKLKRQIKSHVNLQYRIPLGVVQ